jgi:hypothetical protein
MVKLKSFLVEGTEGIISEMGKILSEAPAKPAEILNPSSSRFSFFLNPTLLDFPGKTFAKLLGN